MMIIVMMHMCYEQGLMGPIQWSLNNHKNTKTCVHACPLTDGRVPHTARTTVTNHIQEAYH